MLPLMKNKHLSLSLVSIDRGICILILIACQRHIHDQFDLPRHV